MRTIEAQPAPIVCRIDVTPVFDLGEVAATYCMTGAASKVDMGRLICRTAKGALLAGIIPAKDGHVTLAGPKSLLKTAIDHRDILGRENPAATPPVR
jgi:hypothetical protein